MLGGPLRCWDTVCCRWPAALVGAKLVTALALSGMLNGTTLLSYPGLRRPPGHTTATLCRSICAPSKIIRCGNAELHTQNPHRHHQEASKQFFSFVKSNTKAAWRSAGIQRPPVPHPFNLGAVLQLLLRKLEQKKRWKTCLAPIG